MDTTVFVAGYITQLVGTSALLREIWKKRSVYGLSVDTQICQLLATAVRAVWSYETRIMHMTVGYVELALSILACVATVWSWWCLRGTAARNRVWLKWWMVLIGCGALAYGFHPGSKRLSLQITVAFTFYVECAALTPQLLLLRKINDADGIATSYILLTSLSRFLRIAFWALLYTQGDLFPGLLIADVIHTVLCAHFVRAWWQCLRNRKGGILGAARPHKKLR